MELIYGELRYVLFLACPSSPEYVYLFSILCVVALTFLMFRLYFAFDV